MTPGRACRVERAAEGRARGAGPSRARRAEREDQAWRVPSGNAHFVSSPGRSAEGLQERRAGQQGRSVKQRDGQRRALEECSLCEQPRAGRRRWGSSGGRREGENSAEDGGAGELCSGGCPRTGLRETCVLERSFPARLQVGAPLPRPLPAPAGGRDQPPLRIFSRRRGARRLVYIGPSARRSLWNTPKTTSRT